MKLRRILVRRIPGIPEPGFEIDRLGDGINVIVGPNASGKTSVLRAFRAALYARELAGKSIHVEATFDDGEDSGVVEVARVGTTVTWSRDGQRIEAPPLPEHRFVPCYTLHVENLLTSDADTDSDIARHIARELAGGYDLEATRRECGFSVRAQIGRSESKEFDEASSELYRIQRKHRELHQEEQRLDSLEEERSEADAAGREAALVDRARRLLEKRGEKCRMERQRAALPADLDRLLGTEAGTLERLREERKGTAESLAQVEAELWMAERSLAETRLARSGLDEASIAEVRLRLGQQQRLEDDIERERMRGYETMGARDRALQMLGGAPGERARLNPNTIQAVEQALDTSRRLSADLRAAEAEIEGLPDPETAGSRSSSASNPERLRDARHELLRWLSAATFPQAEIWRMVALGLLAVAAAVGAVIVGQLVHPAGFGLLLPAAIGAAWLLIRPDAGAVRRREAERRFRALVGIERPESWEVSRVEARLFELDRELVDVRYRAEEMRRRQVVERRRTNIASDLDQVRGKLAEIAERVQFDPETLDVPFHRWLLLTDQYDRADIACHESNARLSERERESIAARTGIATFLLEHGETPGAADGDVVLPGGDGLGLTPPPSDVLLQRLDRLAERVRRRDEARRGIAAGKERRERLIAEIRNRDEAIASLFREVRLEPGDEAELHRRLGYLEEWRRLDRELTEVHGAEEELRIGLEEREDLLALIEQGDQPELTRRAEALDKKASRSRVLADEMTRIRTLVDRAVEGRELEKARARRQRADDALHRRYEESTRAVLGDFLLERVESEHVKTSRPALLRRAEDWFARFTRHQFELVMGSSRDEFAARETATGEWRSLSELSSGTRMQLLLAVRAAFALEVEKGRAPLPLFLDEALTTADPERFQAAAESLQRFAAEASRQIFYFTARREEVGYWSMGAPLETDLSEVRRTGRTVAHPAEVELPPGEPEPPRPDGIAAEEYAVLIGVVPVHPWEAPSGIHLFHVLRDDLELLWRLLRAGIHRLGPLESLLQSGESDLLLARDECAALKLRIAGTKAWVDAWRTGRGRPVDHDALAASGAVSTVFMERLERLAGEVNGDAERILQAIENGAAPHFRATNRVQLEDWFRENGHLVDSGLLDRHALDRRVAVALTHHGLAAESALREAARLARSLAAGIGG